MEESEGWSAQILLRFNIAGQLPSSPVETLNISGTLCTDLSALSGCVLWAMVAALHPHSGEGPVPLGGVC